MRRLLLFVVLATALVALVGCGSSPTPTNPTPVPTDTATVTITVTGSGTPVVGAKVALGSVASADTDGVGQVRFTNVPYGTYTASASGVFGFANGQSSVDVRSAKVSANLSMAATTDVVRDFVHSDQQGRDLQSGDTVTCPDTLRIGGRYVVANREPGSKYQAHADILLSSVFGVMPKMGPGGFLTMTDNTWLHVQNVIGKPSVSTNDGPRTYYDTTDTIAVSLAKIEIPNTGKFTISPRKEPFVLHYDCPAQ